MVWHRPHRLPIVREEAPGDSGPASLAAVLAYHGKTVALSDVRLHAGADADGPPPDALLRAATHYGMAARFLVVEPDDLRTLPAGAIVVSARHRYRVLEAVERGKLHLIDPAVGRQAVTIADFTQSFTGRAILLEPGDGAAPPSRRPSAGGSVLPLLRELLVYRGIIGRLVLVTIVAQLLAAALPLLTGVLIDRVIPRGDYSLLGVLTAGYCAIQMLAAVAAFTRAQLSIHFRVQLESSFTIRFLNHLVDLAWSYFQQRTPGDLMMRLGSNSAVRGILTSTVLSTFLDGLMASVYVVLLLLFSPLLTLGVAALTAVRLTIMVVQRRRQHALLRDTLDNQARSQTLQVEMLNGMETLKAMGLERSAAAEWEEAFVTGLELSARRSRVEARFGVLLTAINTISTLALLFYGTFMVLEGQWTLGNMMAFNALAAGLSGPMNGLASAALQLQMVEVYLERLNEVLRTPAEQALAVVHPAPAISGEIRLEDVSFRYSTASAMMIDRVSLFVPAGARLVIVGPSGSGKSTLARLLASLYTPERGRVLFDGIDVRALERRSLRRQLGLVTQDVQLFGASIRRNIALSDPTMSLARVMKAASLACIHDHIATLPLGYDTVLSSRGLSLSGGQRQRLAIARAFAAEPRVLILDEATSHLDTETEQRIDENLKLLQCTSIVVTHRISTARRADVIAVLQAGRIVELGTHDELVHADGAYRALITGRDARAVGIL